MNPHPTQHHHYHLHHPLSPALADIFLLASPPEKHAAPRNQHKSNVRSTNCDTLQRNKQIKVRTADHFFEVMASAVVTTSGRANKWTMS